MRNSMQIGVVIAHFGNVRDTSECLESLSKVKKQGYSLFVYLIDNDPCNRFVFPFSRYKLKGKVIVFQKNLGYGAAVNKGSKIAITDGCKYVLHLSNDVIVQEDIILKSIPYFKQKNVGAISPMIVYYDKPDTVWCIDGCLNELFLFTRYPYMNKKVNDIPYIFPIESEFAAACLFIRSSVFKQVGFFDERYFINVEDVEWCFRLRKAGYKLFFIPFPLALHKVSAGSGIRGTNMLNSYNAFFYARNFFIFLRDHRKKLHVSTALFGQMCIRLPFYIFFRSSSFSAVIAYLRGYMHGLFYLCTGKLLS